MDFENLINKSNEYYRQQNIAYIYKKPVPIQIVSVDYQSRQTAKITEAYFKTPSTTDYNGIYKGKYIDFEAKETVSNRFSLNKIYDHQLIHLKKCKQLGGICFILIYFKTYEKIILIDIDNFINYFEQNNIKSISVDEALNIGKLVKIGINPRIDYINSIS